MRPHASVPPPPPPADARGETVLKSPVRLWAYAGYNFWRWDLVMELGGAPGVMEYWIVCSTDHFFLSPHK